MWFGLQVSATQGHPPLSFPLPILATDLYLLLQSPGDSLAEEPTLSRALGSITQMLVPATRE